MAGSVQSSFPNQGRAGAGCAMSRTAGISAPLDVKWQLPCACWPKIVLRLPPACPPATTSTAHLIQSSQLKSSSQLAHCCLGLSGESSGDFYIDSHGLNLKPSPRGFSRRADPAITTDVRRLQCPRAPSPLCRLVPPRSASMWAHAPLHAQDCTTQNYVQPWRGPEQHTIPTPVQWTWLADMAMVGLSRAGSRAKRRRSCGSFLRR